MGVEKEITKAKDLANFGADVNDLNCIHPYEEKKTHVFRTFLTEAREVFGPNGKNEFGKQKLFFKAPWMPFCEMWHSRKSLKFQRKVSRSNFCWGLKQKFANAKNFPDRFLASFN